MTFLIYIILSEIFCIFWTFFLIQVNGFYTFLRFSNFAKLQQYMNDVENLKKKRKKKADT